MKFTAAKQAMFRYLAVLTAASMAAMQGYSILFNNYVRNVRTSVPRRR